MDGDRIKGAVGKMNLRDKTAISGGDVVVAAPAVGVGKIMLSDGFLPWNVSEPTMLAVGCTFSREAAAAAGNNMAIDAAKAGRAFAGVAGAGLMQDPMRPDAVRLISEDSYLAGELLEAFTGDGCLGYVLSAALGQNRYADRTVDERALYEEYLRPLRKAGKNAAALWLDGGYLNDKRVAESRDITEMLTKYTPRDIMVMTQPRDGDPVRVISGSGAYFLGADSADAKRVAAAVEHGTLNETKLNRVAERTLGALVNAYEFHKAPPELKKSDIDLVCASAILLKNDGVLPAKHDELTFFGDGQMFDLSMRMFSLADAQKGVGKINVIFVSSDSDEEYATVKAVAEKAKTVVVIANGVASARDYSMANAVLFCPYLPSADGAERIITGATPRGRLPFTWCKRESDYPVNGKYSKRGDYRFNSVRVGHSYLDSVGAEVMYPFGHGLDYGEYEIDRAEFSRDGAKLVASVNIKNNSERAGSPLLQMYFTAVGSRVYGITKKLGAFKRVELAAGESVRAELVADLNDFGVYDSESGSFVTVGGKYKIEIGLSSRDIRASGEVKKVDGSLACIGVSQKLAPSYFEDGVEPSAPELEAVLKTPFIKKQENKPGLVTSPADVKREMKKLKKLIKPRHIRFVEYFMAHKP